MTTRLSDEERTRICQEYEENENVLGAFDHALDAAFAAGVRSSRAGDGLRERVEALADEEIAEAVALNAARANSDKDGKLWIGWLVRRGAALIEEVRAARSSRAGDGLCRDGPGCIHQTRVAVLGEIREVLKAAGVTVTDAEVDLVRAVRALAAPDAGLAPWYGADGSTVMLPAAEVERKRKLAAKVIGAAETAVRTFLATGETSKDDAVLLWRALLALDAAAPDGGATPGDAP